MISFNSELLHNLYSPLAGVSVSDEIFFSSSHSSLIYLPLSSHPYSPTPLPFAPDEPGQLKIYLPKKLLECLPKCSSLPKERHRWNTNEVGARRTQEGDIRGSERQSLFFSFFTGDSSLVNVTLRDEEVANKHNSSFLLRDPKTVTPRGENKKKGGKEREKKNINLSQNPETVHSVKSSCCIFGFEIQTTLG